MVNRNILSINNYIQCLLFRWCQRSQNKLWQFNYILYTCLSIISIHMTSRNNNLEYRCIFHQLVMYLDLNMMYNRLLQFGTLHKLDHKLGKHYQPPQQKCININNYNCSRCTYQADKWNNTTHSSNLGKSSDMVGIFVTPSKSKNDLHIYILLIIIRVLQGMLCISSNLLQSKLNKLGSKNNILDMDRCNNLMDICKQNLIL